MRALLKKLLWVLVLGIISVSFVSVSYSAKPVLNYKRTPLPKNAPKQLRELLGKWQGEWLLAYNEKLKGGLNIININLKTKKVILKYSWGKNADYRISKGSYFYTAKIKEGKNPEITFGKYARFKFVLNDSGILQGTRVYQSQYTTISMHKVH